MRGWWGLEVVHCGRSILSSVINRMQCLKPKEKDETSVPQTSSLDHVMTSSVQVFVHRRHVFTSVV